MIGGAPAFYETEQSLTITREIYFMDVQSTRVNFKYDPRNNEFTCNYSSIYRFILQLFVATSLTDKNQTDHVYSILTVSVEIHNEQSMLIIKLQYAIRRLCCIARKYITAGNDSRYCAYHRGTQRQFSENNCSEDDLRSRIFGTL